MHRLRYHDPARFDLSQPAAFPGRAGEDPIPVLLLVVGSEGSQGIAGRPEIRRERRDVESPRDRCDLPEDLQCPMRRLVVGVNDELTTSHLLIQAEEESVVAP